MGGSGRSEAVTMADVAARAGVSRALVSIVFRGVPGASQETRARVMRAAEELSYRPDERARLLRSTRTRLVGVVLDLRHEFHGELVDRLYGAVEGTGYDLTLGATSRSRDERRAVQSLLDLRCEALVLLGPALPRAGIEDLATRLPVVVVARSLRSRSVDVVRTDDAAGARLAVEHLLALGHRRVAQVDGGRAAGAAERRSGFRAAVAASSLDQAVPTVPGGLTEQHGEDAARALLALRTRPTAVTAFNDHCAAGLVTGLRSAGLRVPEEVSVVGYDDSSVAALSSLRLTTVAQDSAALARSALDLATSRAEDPTLPRREVVVPPHLVVRASTAPPGR